MKFVDALAAKLQTPAHVIWEAYVRQARIDGIVSLIICAVIAGVAVWWVRRGVPFLANYASENHLIIGLGSAAVFIPAIIAIFRLPDVAGALFNPQFWAIQKLLGR